MNPVFCFHSVRPTLAIPPATAWPSYELYAEFKDHLTVEKGWFYDWLPKAKEHWGPELVVTFDDAFRDVMVPAIWSAIKHEIRTIVFVPTCHMGQVFPYAPYDVMDGSEIGFLSGQGVEIGSHGHRHEDMRKVQIGVIEGALSMSKEILEGLTGKRVRAMAPPHGHFDERLVRLAKEIGYEEVHGTNLHSAGKVPGTVGRWQADMNGYRDLDGVEHLWPWEE